MAEQTAANQRVTYHERLPGISWPVIGVLGLFITLEAVSVVILPRVGFSPTQVGIALAGTGIGIIATVQVAWATGRLVSGEITIVDDALEVESSIGPWRHRVEYNLADIEEVRHQTKFRQSFVHILTAEDLRLAGHWKAAETPIRTRQPQQLTSAIQQAIGGSQYFRRASADTTPNVLYEEHITTPHPYRGLVWSLVLLANGLYHSIKLVAHRGVPPRAFYAFGDQPNFLDSFMHWSIFVAVIPLGVWGAWRLWHFSKSKTVRVLRDGVHYRYAGNRKRFYPIERIQGATPLTDQVVLMLRFWIPAIVSSATPHALANAIQRAKLANTPSSESAGTPRHDASLGR